MGFNISENLKSGLHIWKVSAISLVNLATNCRDKNGRLALANKNIQMTKEIKMHSKFQHKDYYCDANLTTQPPRCLLNNIDNNEIQGCILVN